MYSFPALLKKVVRDDRANIGLTREETRWVLQEALEGRLSDLQVVALLVALRQKRESAEELAGVLDAVTRTTGPIDGHLLSNEAGEAPTVAHCGATVGKSHFFLSSPGAALLAAAASRVRVLICARAGDEVNFPMTEVNIFRALDVPVIQDPQEVGRHLARHGVCVTEQRYFHPRLTALSGLKATLGVGTVAQSAEKFVCPVKPTAMIVGAFHLDYLRRLSDAAAHAFDFRLCLVQERDGAVDVMPTGTTKGFWVEGGRVEEWSLSPEAVGMQRQPQGAFSSLSTRQTARLTEDILRGTVGGPYREAVIYNAALLMHTGIPTRSLQACARLARLALEGGRAAVLLDQIRQSNQTVKEE